MSNAPPTREVSQPLPVCIVSPPQSPRLYARICDVISLGLLSADGFECGAEITRDVTTRSLGRVPPTDGGLVPS